MARIVLAEHMHAIARQRLQAAGHNVVTLQAADDLAAFEAVAKDADAIAVRIANVPADLINACPDLKVVAKHGVGTDNIAIDACTSRGIPVTVTADANKTSVVEHTLMFMLALAKKLKPLDAAVRRGDFAVRGRAEGFGRDLAGSTAMIIGAGRIGQALVPVLNAFGMRVLACDPQLSTEDAATLGCAKVGDFRNHLGETDFLTVHVPLTTENRHLIGAAELSALPTTAFVINNARGGIVDEHALVAALNTGEIAGAATDVFDGEPPPSDHPFFANDKILLAPHSGGNTVQCLERMAASTADNIIAVLDGTIEPRFVFNPDVLGLRR